MNSKWYNNELSTHTALGTTLAGTFATCFSIQLTHLVLPEFGKNKHFFSRSRKCLPRSSYYATNLVLFFLYKHPIFPTTMAFPYPIAYAALQASPRWLAPDIHSVGNLAQVPLDIMRPSGSQSTIFTNLTLLIPLTISIWVETNWLAGS